MYKLFVPFALILTHSVCAQLTVESIMRDPKWIGSSPSSITWMADSRAVQFSWNPDRAADDSMYLYALAGGGPEKIRYADALRNAALTGGVSNQAGTLRVFAYRGDVWLQETKTGKTRLITQTEDAESSPRFIGNDEWICFTRNQNLYAWHITTGVTRQLTNFVKGGSGPRNGRPESGARPAGQEPWLVAQQLELFQVLSERKAKRDARSAFLKTIKEYDTLRAIEIGEKLLQGAEPSPNGRFITYRLVQPASGKATIVPDYVTESGFTTDLNTRMKVGHVQGKYELWLFDREKNREVQLLMDSLPGITDLPDFQRTGGKTTGKVRSVYFGAVSWNPSGTRAVVDIRSQDNKDRWLMQLDPETGKLQLVDRQRDEAWIAGPGISAWGGRMGWISEVQFYFQSEASGYSHVYVADVSNGQRKALTSGNYEVQELILSKSKKHFYLLTNETHPGKQHWYRMNADGSGKQQITSLEGGHEVVLSPDEQWIAYRYSYMNRPWELYVQENRPGARPKQVTDKAISAEFRQYPWREAKLVTIPAADGAKVYARVYEPSPEKKNKAAVIFVHGAGYLQNAHFWWSSYFREYMFHNLLVDKGYTVLDIDYRGSAGYGRDWRTGIYRHMGGKDLSDHVDAASYLTANLGVDANRIGIYGGSYGGFITLMALFTTPDVFRAGAALRPVTDWAHYNHGYTANILNEPFADSLAYKRSSPINFAGGLKNHLLICHGMVDVNVHFQDVVRLSQKLIELGKDNWELAVYPVEDHGFVEPSSWTDEYKRILKLFDEKLLK
jgi:dipeptidyl aminopeptidase/acylaminoacyl peptidase